MKDLSINETVVVSAGQSEIQYVADKIIETMQAVNRVDWNCSIYLGKSLGTVLKQATDFVGKVAKYFSNR